MSKEVTYKDLIAFHPGSYVEDIIDNLDLTQDEFANRLETTPKTLSKIINGEARISTDIANKLSRLTGISIKTWLNLQINFDAKVAEIENQQNQDEQDICRMIDFKYFKNNGFISSDKKYKVADKVSFLRQLLNIASLTQLSKFNPLISYRHSQVFNEKSIVNSNVMLELALNKARNITSNKYKKDKLQTVLRDIKKMTAESPDEFHPKLKELLLECGIVLVALPKLTNANLNGATKKFKSGSVLLLITDKDKRADIFWFSLLHELGHIYYEDFTSSNSKEEYEEKEQRADEFARDFFIPADAYKKFIEDNSFNRTQIMEFSKNLGIAPGIVVGRLQRDKRIDYRKFNDLRPSYQIFLS